MWSTHSQINAQYESAIDLVGFFLKPQKHLSLRVRFQIYISVNTKTYSYCFCTISILKILITPWPIIILHKIMHRTEYLPIPNTKYLCICIVFLVFNNRWNSNNLMSKNLKRWKSYMVVDCQRSLWLINLIIWP